VVLAVVILGEEGRERKGGRRRGRGGDVGRMKILVVVMVVVMVGTSFVKVYGNGSCVRCASAGGGGAAE
jgi:hypothetical protein